MAPRPTSPSTLAHQARYVNAHQCNARQSAGLTLLSFLVVLQGNYFAQLPTGTACRSYYFQFMSASGGVYRYPETGFFNTFGEGSCASDWSETAGACVPLARAGEDFTSD
jgi:hypothetical protein